MAVGTKKTQVFAPVVTIVPVYVVELQRDGRAAPFGEVAPIASRPKDAGSQQTPLQLVGLNRRRIAEVGLERPSGRKLAIAAPRSTRKVRSIDRTPLEGTTQSVVVATVGGDVETRENLAQ